MSGALGFMTSAAFRVARDVIHGTDDQTLADMVDATRIPAPLYGETERGRWFAGRLRETGLQPVIDDVGNVIAVTPSASPDAPRIVVASHLDTVFAADTDLDVRRDGSRLTGPGISDNSRGLAGILALARGLASAGWPTRSPVAFVGTVGEEGAGDLRGAKHYVATHGGRTGAFIALDGAGATRVINAGVGSRRLRVTIRGPGGHSWSDWGAPNAVHAAGRTVAALLRLPLPESPRTTLTAARIGGGTSINAIPAEAWFELDLRSELLEPLADLEARVRSAVEHAAKAEGRTAGAMTHAIDVIGDRPAGATRPSDPLVALAVAATEVMGLTPQLASSSTDANVAMAAGIPAIAIGGGGDAGGMHTVGEWYDNGGGPSGLERALVVVLGAAGLA
ncbi:MAG TPA: M20/M25/M40 family metallo-hydrolase [Longimicrobiales bacterium]|nr:M20/M25/M40 family metallo-hydrolase [Longimicrobiales bacterium]